MGEAQTPHFYDFGIFEPVTKPQNQLFLSLQTPGHLKESRKIPKHLQRSLWAFPFFGFMLKMDRQTPLTPQFFLVRVLLA